MLGSRATLCALPHGALVAEPLAEGVVRGQRMHLLHQRGMLQAGLSSVSLIWSRSARQLLRRFLWRLPCDTAHGELQSALHIQMEALLLGL